ncbi:MAG: DUF4124 domain-containing protein, partial [Burkholderiales bacterium]
MVAALAANAAAFAQVYKSTDPSGRVQYSDRPPAQGLPPPAPSHSTLGDLNSLAGEWIVVNLRRQGRLVEDTTYV